MDTATLVIVLESACCLGLEAGQGWGWGLIFVVAVAGAEDGAWAGYGLG